ncbi:type VI secretion system contractile sheath large subunit [Methylovirgula sp. 4M-Z18]|uniref:type VI secretion system contractile sheath large subunit n=1 Tax=Methylovirgula sp. 4M-Z18 TaxID=2293567 RepID=UPI000E2E80A1|nr:type VI secretion system contractile sheath large subunit [Methylovirgula sp. 4M-Z18]RFB76346.1 type VI secretion system contractile sheath large subunit [Methylovirgula sp. 4M-Z18]
MAETAASKPTSTTTETRDLDTFSSLLRKSFKPRNDSAASEVENAVATLVRQALEDTSLVKEDVLDTIDSMIAKLDQQLSIQLNEILHAPEFQKLESAWRGLNYLVFNTETDTTLKIRFMNVSKGELYREFKVYPGARWDQSPIFKKLYEAEYGQLGGDPYGCLVGDYYFDHSPPDVQLLRDISKISAAAHAPFFAAANPSVMGMDSWNELSNPRDIAKIFDTPDYAAFRSLRDQPDSRYVGLCMPRVLARQPYGAKSEPVEEFAFEEDTDGHHGAKYAWMNAAYAMAANVNRAFKEYGWTVRIRGVQSGGEVINLPTHTFPTDDGGIDLKCPTEIAISDRREAEISKAGLLPLIHRKNTDKAAFIGAQSLYKPHKMDTDEATASENLSSRLPYMFAVSRFAHYLKCMVRDKIGATMEQDQLQKWLQTWINRYVDGDPKNSTEAIKAKKPLAAAKVEVFPDEENPGYYAARFYLRPHYQLEGMDIGISLVSRLPNSQK